MEENSDVVERLQSLREAVRFQLDNHIIAQRLSENLVLFIVFVSPCLGFVLGRVFLLQKSCAFTDSSFGFLNNLPLRFFLEKNVMQLDINQLRQEYQKAALDAAQVDAEPIVQFGKWFQEALDAGVPEPNAMTLATATSEGKPSARIVLLKGFDRQGFSFFTNYQSRKGLEFEQNPFAALVFWWIELERQVRIEGRVEKLPPEQSAEYFQSRPRGSQIGAWASPQSAVIESRAVLETRVHELEQEYAGVETLPRPEHWGGYLVIPTIIEFWQGRPNRLHDRICYTLQSDGTWNIKRLAP